MFSVHFRDCVTTAPTQLQQIRVGRQAREGSGSRDNAEPLRLGGPARRGVSPAARLDVLAEHAAADGCSHTDDQDAARSPRLPALREGSSHRPRRRPDVRGRHPRSPRVLGALSHLCDPVRRWHSRRNRPLLRRGDAGSAGHYSARVARAGRCAARRRRLRLPRGALSLLPGRLQPAVQHGRRAAFRRAQGARRHVERRRAALAAQPAGGAARCAPRHRRVRPARRALRARRRAAALPSPRFSLRRRGPPRRIRRPRPPHRRVPAAGDAKRHRRRLRRLRGESDSGGAGCSRGAARCGALGGGAELFGAPRRLERAAVAARAAARPRPRSERRRHRRSHPPVHARSPADGGGGAAARSARARVGSFRGGCEAVCAARGGQASPAGRRRGGGAVP